MPAYRSITIALHSQFDVETLPEYYPAPKADYISRGLAGFLPEPFNGRFNTCSVYTPALSGSTFWIGYSVSPPVPDNHYFLFKLYIDGVHIVSWAAGKEEGWKGKTMFGLFERPKDEQGKKHAEKRVLCFSALKEGHVIDPFDEKACIEIKVHRANGRRRIERKMEEYSKTEHATTKTGINLVNAGHAGAELPKRFYKFALIDPVDQPFATFRYYYRTWDQLRDLGLLEDQWNVAEDNDLSVIEPLDDDVPDRIEEDVDEDEDEDDGSSSTVTPDAMNSALPPRISSRQVNIVSKEPDTYVPRNAPTNRSDEHADKHMKQRFSCARTSSQLYCQSLPSTADFDVHEPSVRPLTKLPQENELFSPTSYQPHPAYPDSPRKVTRENISTPLPGAHDSQGRSASALMKAISSWKRRGTQKGMDTELRHGAQSAS